MPSSVIDNVSRSWLRRRATSIRLAFPWRIELPIAPATPHDHGLDRDELVSRDTGHAPERPPGPDTHLSAS